MKKIIFALPAISALLLACNSSSQKKENTVKPVAHPQSQQEKVNLPPPSKSHVNASKVIGWPAGKTPVAPQGFTVTKFADSLNNPRWIYVLPNGDVLVAEAKKEEGGLQKLGEKISGMSKSQSQAEPLNRIILFRDTNKDGKPDQQTNFISNLHMPFGMLLLDHYIYVAQTDALWRYPYKDGETSINEKGEKILDLPGEGRHWTRSLIANADGSKIYIGVGSSSNVGEHGMEAENRRACIIEINPDGTGEKIYASGLRNPIGMAWQPGTKTLWAVINERDELGDDLVPDYFTSVKEGGFYGWPYAYIGQHVDERIKESERRPDLVAKTLVPDVLLGSHVAALGLTFYVAKMFPAQYHNGAFIGEHGSWNRSTLSGYKVSFVPFANGKPGEPQDFLTGFIANQEKSEVYGRPVGVAVMQDGSLLVADDAANTIWRVSYTGH
jgi:glucose/arabinose dehydrogenase